MAETTLVGASRLKDFELYTSKIGSLIPSYSKVPPEGTLRISVQSTEVSKTEWSELYRVIGGKDGSTPDKFVLPYKAKEGDLEYYLVGKVLLSEPTVSGHVIAQTFSYDNLDSEGYFVFNHGIGHLNPLIEVRDENNGQVLVSKIINEVGRSRLLIKGSFQTPWIGVWTALALG